MICLLLVALHTNAMRQKLPILIRRILKQFSVYLIVHILSAYEEKKTRTAMHLKEINNFYKLIEKQM